jgi:hypothetical protein
MRGSARSLGRSALAALVIMGAGCTAIVNLIEPITPHDGIYMQRRPQYALWWSLTERCSGRVGDLSKIHWYVVPGADVIGASGALGQENSLIDRIVLAWNSVDSGPVVRHEMLHALIRTRGHPVEYFQQKCGDVVDCASRCLDDGGSPPTGDVTGPIVELEDVDIRSYTEPTVPSIALDTGWFALTVEISNPNSFPVRVHLQPVYPGVDAAATFGYRGVLCNTTLETIPRRYDRSDTLLVMEPNEIRRRVFDLRVDGLCNQYRAFFNGDSMPEFRVEAAP